MSGSSAPRRAVILDCDPGTDDALALWLALASPELDLRIVTVAGGNAGLARTLPNAAAVVGLEAPGLQHTAGTAYWKAALAARSSVVAASCVPVTRPCSCWTITS